MRSAGSSVLAAVVIVTSFAVPSLVSAASAEAASEQKRISIEFRGNLRDALKKIASKGGLNLVVTGDLDQPSEVYLKDVTAEDALRTIAQGYNLHIQKSGSIWTLRPMTKEEVTSAQAAPPVLPSAPQAPVAPPPPVVLSPNPPAAGPVPPVPPVPPIPEISAGMTDDDIEAAMRQAEAIAERAEEEAEAAVERAQEELEAAREAAESQVGLARERAEEVRERAGEMRERAEEMRERAREARDQARVARNQAREALRSAREHMDQRVGAGPVHVKEGEVVEDAVSYGGPLTIDGHVENDAVAFGGAITLGPKAWVEGDVVSFGGPIKRADGAVVEGEVHSFGGAVIGKAVKDGMVKAELPPRHMHRSANPVAVFLAWFMVLFAVGFLTALVAPERMKAIQEEIRNKPVASGLSGFLGTLALIPLTILLVVTLIGIPIAALVVWPVATLAAAVGFAAVASVLGMRLPIFRGHKTQALVLALGLALLLLVAQIPVLGPIAVTFLAFVGFGAIIRTRFGRRRPGSSIDATDIPTATPA